MGEGFSPPSIKKVGKYMYTISDILRDVDCGILANNMIETCFSYRIIYFMNRNGKGTKHYTDTSYGDLRKALEDIIRNNLSLTDSVTVAAVTVRKNGQSVALQSRPYSFSLDEYFDKINGKSNSKNNKYIMYGSRYAAG